MKKIAAFLLVVCPLLAQAPANDLCQGSILLPGAGTYAGTNVAATASTFGVGTCGTGAVDVWYRYVASGTGNRLIASTCPPGSATFNCGVDIFTGSTCFTLTTANCNTQWCDTGGIVTGRAITGTVAGTTYWIRVKTVGGGTGTFMLDVAEVPASQSNGTCATAQVVVDGVNAGKSNLGQPQALQAGFTPCVGAGKDVFFSYTATGTGGTIVKTCFPAPTTVPANSIRDSVIAVYANCAGGTPIACSSAGCGGIPGTGANLTNVIFSSSIGTNYIIQVCGAGATTASEGNFDLEIIPPPQNDECLGALPVTLGSNGPFTNQSASDSVGYAGSCSPGYKDLFYYFTPNCGALVTITTGCAGFDTVLSVWNVCGGAELACNDNSSACSPNSSVTVSMNANQNYLIRVASAQLGTYGTFTVDITSGYGLNWAGISSGAVQFSICNGPPNGTYYLFATPTVAAPTGSGWFYGCNLTLNEIMIEINAGFPFHAPLNGFGNFLSPVLGGLPPGLPFDSIAFAVPSGGSSPTANSGAKNFQVP